MKQHKGVSVWGQPFFTQAHACEHAPHQMLALVGRKVVGQGPAASIPAQQRLCIYIYMRYSILGSQYILNTFVDVGLYKHT